MDDTIEVTTPPKPAKVEKQTASPPSSPDSKESRRGSTAVLIAIATLLLGFGFYTLSHRLAPDIGTPAAAESAYVASFLEKSIAVLPFEDLSEGKQDTFLPDGLQDDILTALSKVSDLRVISRTSASTYAPDKYRNYRDIAQSLGVAYILEGTVRRAGEKILVTTQLTDARRDARVFTEKYERDSTNVFGIQAHLVHRVASAMQATITAPEAAAIELRPTKDIMAYGLYVRAQTIIANSYNAQLNKLLQAVDLLDQAIARDHDFYLAYCQLAAAHNYIYFFGFDHTPARIALAGNALKTVERLRPDAGETHLAKATFLYRCFLDYDHARAQLALAQRVLPNNSEIFELTGYIDRRQGLWNESARSLQKAFELDPRNFSLLQQIASSYQELRQFGAMAAALDRAIAIVPHDLDNRITRAYVDVEWRAETRPLHQTIQDLLRENPASAPDLGDQWLYVSLCERDPSAAAQALAAIPATGISPDLNLPHSYCEALVARLKGNEADARKAFLAARTEVEKTVREQPNYGPALSVLGLIDAALGRKDDAMREGRHALEILPPTKDAIDGAEVMKYLGVIYAWCGEKDLALEQIAATLRIPSTLSYGNLKLHPNWDNLRGDPRFEKIVAGLAPKAVAN
jgi:TolB-like protein/tetratricopeptide (TPR) repeat protein